MVFRKGKKHLAQIATELQEGKHARYSEPGGSRRGMKSPSGTSIQSIHHFICIYVDMIGKPLQNIPSWKISTRPMWLRVICSPRRAVACSRCKSTRQSPLRDWLNTYSIQKKGWYYKRRVWFPLHCVQRQWNLTVPLFIRLQLRSAAPSFIVLTGSSDYLRPLQPEIKLKVSQR